jgi:acetyl esterase/lipase
LRSRWVSSFGVIATEGRERSFIAVYRSGRGTTEHPYPAGLEDSYAVLQWALDKGDEYGIDPERLGVLGESAGGGLAAALSLLARDRRGPHLTAQFLDAPTIDDRLDTPSMTTLSDTPAWQSVNSPHSWRYYLQGTAEPGGTNVPMYAAPARATVKTCPGFRRHTSRLTKLTRLETRDLTARADSSRRGCPPRCTTTPARSTWRTSSQEPPAELE